MAALPRRITKVRSIGLQFALIWCMLLVVVDIVVAKKEIR
jgi:hypothetical protein